MMSVVGLNMVVRPHSEVAVATIRVDLSGVRELVRDMNSLKVNLRRARGDMMRGWRGAFMTSFWDVYAGQPAPGNARVLPTMYRGEFARGLVVRVDPNGRWMKIDDLAQHAEVVEYGVGAGYSPDYADIREWVIDKLGGAGDDYEIDRATRAVIRNIQRRGLAGHRVLQRAVDNPEFLAALETIAERAYTTAIDESIK
jgi:hypothetical protein